MKKFVVFLIFVSGAMFFGCKKGSKAGISIYSGKVLVRGTEGIGGSPKFYLVDITDASTLDTVHLENAAYVSMYRDISFNGSLIAYSPKPGPLSVNGPIILIKPDGSFVDSLHPDTTDGKYWGGCAISPDGDMVAYPIQRSDGSFDIRAFKKTGSGWKDTLLFSGTYYYSGNAPIVFSHDGKKLLVGTISYGPLLWELDISTGSGNLIKAHGDTLPGYFGSWWYFYSYDDSKIIFEYDDPRSNEEEKVMVINCDGTGLEILYEGTLVNTPCSMPDGKIVFVGIGAQTYSVHVMNPDGSDLHEVPNFPQDFWCYGLVAPLK